jgi:hypothetical protein
MRRDSDDGGSSDSASVVELEWMPRSTEITHTQSTLSELVGCAKSGYRRGYDVSLVNPERRQSAGDKGDKRTGREQVDVFGPALPPLDQHNELKGDKNREVTGNTPAKRLRRSASSSSSGTSKSCSSSSSDSSSSSSSGSSSRSGSARNKVQNKKRSLSDNSRGGESVGQTNKTRDSTDRKSHVQDPKRRESAGGSAKFVSSVEKTARRRSRSTSVARRAGEERRLSKNSADLEKRRGIRSDDDQRHRTNRSDTVGAKQARERFEDHNRRSSLDRRSRDGKSTNDRRRSNYSSTKSPSRSQSRERKKPPSERSAAEKKEDRYQTVVNSSKSNSVFADNKQERSRDVAISSRSDAAIPAGKQGSKTDAGERKTEKPKETLEDMEAFLKQLKAQSKLKAIKK